MKSNSRLAGTSSPYLTAHADNPVDWWPWGPEAFAEARRRDVPVFISIGYSTCHWCHVMAEESFEDPAVAAVVNETTVPIKVDREQHPDVDAYYMQATIALSGQGGWPMTVFADADGRPFFADTYFPATPRPEPQPGRPSFSQVIDAVHRTWTTDRGKIDELTDKLNDALAGSAESDLDESSATDTTGSMTQQATAELPTRIVQRMRASEQPTGGFTGAPKFPPTAALLGLVRWAENTTSGEAAGEVLDIAARTWRPILTGGLFDHVEGGFHRYCVDEDWTVPHFEKTLYDNALLLRALAAYTVCRPEDTAAASALEMTRSFLDTRLRVGDLFASGLDADTVVDDGEENGAHRVEGYTYTWTPEELGRFGLAGESDLDGRRILTARDGDPDTDPETGALTENTRAALAGLRAERPQPAVDTKVVTAWNAMTSVALSELGDAQGAATVDALWAHAVDRDEEGTVLAVRRCTGTPDAPAGLEDCAWLLLALVRAVEHTGAEHHLARISELVRHIQVTFATDAPGRWYDAATPVAATGVRPRDPYDGATPAAVGVLAEALSFAGGLATAMEDADIRTVGGRWRAEARRILDTHTEVVERHLVGAGGWLCALQSHLAGPVQATTREASDAQTAALRASLGTSALILRAEDGARLLGQTPDGPVSQVCRDGVCQIAEALD